MVKKGVCPGGDWNPGVGGRSKLSLKTSFLKNRMIHKVATKDQKQRTLKHVVPHTLGRPLCAKPVFVRIYGSALGTAA